MSPPAGPTPDAGAGYVPALDGLRAVAVLAVLAYHAGVDAVPGGYLGVDVFLVLSGYLITTLLLAEWRSRGAIGVGRFWERRARRLVPAMALVVGVVVVRAALTTFTSGLRGEVVASLSWVQNWYLAVQHGSYFTVFGEPSPLVHLWSLAVEAQWYLVWPVVLAGSLAISRGRTVWVASGTLALAAASALAMGAWFDPGADPSRLFYGTDTRGHVLLVGAALALLLHRDGARSGAPSRWWTPAGLAGAAVLAWSFLNLADLEPRLYRGGFGVVAVAAAVVVAAGLRPRSPIARVLRFGPLPALGRVSYGLYLWHWPLYLWLGRSLATTALAVLLAAASYQLVELPVRRARPSMRAPALAFTMAGAAAVAAVALALGGTLPPGRTPIPSAAEGPRSRAGGEGASSPGADAPTIAPAPTPGADVTRVEVAGDSVAWTLAEDFGRIAVSDDVIVDYRASFLGCGLVAGQPYNDGRPVLWADPACEQWEARWRQGLEEFRPDVFVVLIGAWEVMDRRTDAGFLKAESAEYEAYIRSELERGIDLVTGEGVPLVLLTAPCNRPDDAAASREVSDRGDDTRVAWINEILRRTAASAGGDVTVADLNALACPRGRYLAEHDGQPLRTDGVHFTPEGARFVWSWLLPQLTGRA